MPSARRVDPFDEDPFGGRWVDSARCDESCTVDCGRCKGHPIYDLKRRVRRAVWFSRDAHGGVPFGDGKRYWQQGYDEARRAVIRELDATQRAAIDHSPDAFSLAENRQMGQVTD